MPHFIVSSEEAQMGDKVIIYGYRIRDGSVNDVVMLTDIGSLSDRKLSENCETHQVYGFGKRYLVESGMSGGVVLQAATLEIIGYVLGYDHPHNEDRKDDVFVALHTAIIRNPILRKLVTFSHQRRAIRTNLARRLLSLAGFAVNVERLGDEPGLDECLVCSRGEGVLKNIVLIIIATSEQMWNAKNLKELHLLLKVRAQTRNIHFDRAFVVVEPDIIDDKSLDFTITLEDLRHATPTSLQVDFSDGNLKTTGLITGTFLPRSVVHGYSDPPEPAIEAITNCVRNGVKLIVLTGLVDSGKSTVIANFRSIAEARMLDGDIHSPSTHELDLTTDFIDKIPRGKQTDAGPIMVSLIGFDSMWLSGDSAKTLRKLRLIVSELEKRFCDWSIILSISGGLEQTKRIIGSALKDIEQIGDFTILELLPLSPDVVKKALLFELGAADGNAWWKTVESSQEIFQIAQWPTGLSVLLDRVVQASWSDHLANQIEVIGAIVNGFLGRISRSTEDLPPFATLNFLVALAEEINATQNMQVSVDRARRIYSEVVPQTHSIHAIAVTDVLVPGLISHSLSPGSVGFESPIFFHYLLSLAILKRLKSSDLTNTNPLFHRRMPVALLKDVVQLGIDEEQLWRLVKATKGKKTNEVGFIGGNCISLLRLINADFRNCQLGHCNLQGGIFTDCNLFEADLSGAILVDVGLANSDIQSANFSDSDLTRADLKSGCTVYQLSAHCGQVYGATSSRHLVRINLADRDSEFITDISGFSDAVFAVAVSVNENLLVAGGQDGTIRGWDLTNNEPKFILRGHFSDIRSIAFADSMIISGSVDGQVNVWSPWSLTLINSFRLCGGEIWSLAMLDVNTAAVQCDRNHVHIISVVDGTEINVYDLPHDYTRRLIFDSKSNRIFIGGIESIWMLDLKNHKKRLIKVDHPSVRTVFPTNNDGYLIGGAYGIVLWSNKEFSYFKEVYRNDKDYIADFAPYSDDTVLGSGAGGWLFLLEKSPKGWTLKEDLGALDSRYKLYATGANFRGAKGIPDERKSRLKDAGAVF
jgi:uncharacterized protein YjbI with pentapeptide repeats